MKNKIIDSSLRTKTLRGVGWMGLSTVGKLTLQLFFMAILARILGPEAYGVQAIAMVLISFSQLISDGGLGKAIIQKQVSSDSQLSTVYYSSIIIGCCVSATISCFADTIATFFNNEILSDILKALSIIFIIKGFSVVAEAMAFKRMDFKPVAVRDVISYLISYGLIAIPLAYMNWGVWALVFATITQELIKTILIIIYVPHCKRAQFFDIKHIKELYKFAGGITLSGIFNKIATNADTLIIGKLLSVNLLGVYSRGYKLMQLPAGLFGSVLSSALFPALSSIKNEFDKTQKIHNKLIALTAFVIIPFSVLMFSVSNEIVSILLGPKWYDVGPVLQVLSMGIYFRIGYKINGEIIKSSGKVFQLTLAQITYAISIIVCSYIGHFNGIYGVAYGVLIALCLHFLLMLYIGSKHTKLSLIQILSAHVLPVLMSACLYLVLHFIHSSSFYLLSHDFIKILISLLFFVIIIVFCLIIYKERDEISWLISVIKRN